MDLTILTWNVWFGEHRFDERATALLAELDRRRPHVILLQEVTPPLLARLVRARWVRDGYELSDETGATIGGYGVVILSRLPVERFERMHLPSEMGRALLVADLACGLSVATVHLESTRPCVDRRVTQLGLIQPHLAATRPHVVLAGDMNFTPDDPRETAALDPSFVDLWPALRDDDPGYTVDTDLNAMRYAFVKAAHTRKRIDRVFLRSDLWRGLTIRRVGTEPFDGVSGFVSDHFGLQASLTKPS